MAKDKTAELRKGDKVVAATDLRRVPAGTPGRVRMVAGLQWTRYRVDFENGVSIGSIDRDLLARPGEWPAANGSAPD
jgi:hypothetical protein